MKILICGVTGSVGKQSIDVIEQLGDEIVGVVYNKNLSEMKNLLDTKLSKYKNILVYSPTVKNMNNVFSIQEMIDKSKPDLIINAVSGFDGLIVTLLAIKNNIDLANANKESFVAAGWYINKILQCSLTNIYPIDSEHSALYDLIVNSKKKIKRLLITASGGPFYNKDKNDLVSVKFDDAVKHPKWNMGYKISIDSATLMNKCFEMIEAKYLFNANNIVAVYHPSATIHSLIEFEDNSVFAHMSSPDMKLAIGLAINKYNLIEKPLISPLDFTSMTLILEKISSEKYKPIKWAQEVIKTDSKILPLILISANDTCVELFKENKISFLQITEIIEECISVFSKYIINSVRHIFQLNLLIGSYIKKKYK